MGENPPPQIEIDPRFDRAFPEQAESIRRWNDQMMDWWRNAQEN